MSPRYAPSLPLPRLAPTSATTSRSPPIAGREKAARAQCEWYIRNKRSWYFLSVGGVDKIRAEAIK
jgi:hypothetical protein